MRIRSEHTRHDPTPPPLGSDRPLAALAGTAVRERKNRHKEAEDHKRPPESLKRSGSSPSSLRAPLEEWMRDSKPFFNK